eukprot:TRINITY_DN2584_c0_g2_i1.p1 TRINITY_DN2584_c0_g2~~TRINITY_DN2584_c0_g2_i1.p1  ORF type:complete len:443 (-),score=49.78 TRINITY_DN2584_c0_g2_i1:340-1602(-)
MGKHDFLTPKAIANRIKAKGLQKLRWYCQLCQKQCRDENGFQCHIKSESHRRQMELFGHNPGRVVHGYSEEFEHDFMTLLKRAHPFSRVRANTVYNEYIKDRDHVHMNSTRWYTLTGFVQYLGKSGKCIVDQDEEGVWWIKLNQEDPFESISKGKKRSRDEREGEDEIRNQKFLDKQVRRANQQAQQGDQEDENSDDDNDKSVFQQDEQSGPIQIVLGSNKNEDETKLKDTKSIRVGNYEIEDDETIGVVQSDVMKQLKQQKKASALDRLMKQDKVIQQQRKLKATNQSGSQMEDKVDNEKEVQDLPWLYEDIVVKIRSPALKKQGYYGKKAVVKRIIDGYVGELEMIEGGSKVRVDQAELETVIPGFGGLVMIVLGNMKGKFGQLISIKQEQFKAEVEIQDESRKIRLFDYEQICKVIK